MDRPLKHSTKFFSSTIRKRLRQFEIRVYRANHKTLNLKQSINLTHIIKQEKICVLFSKRNEIE